MSAELMVGVFGLSGIASGFLAGLFGIGGGLIMVPVLIYTFKTMGMAAEHILTMALGTSMAAIVFSRRVLMVIIARVAPRSRRSAVPFPGSSPGF